MRLVAMRAFDMPDISFAERTSINLFVQDDHFIATRTFGECEFCLATGTGLAVGKDGLIAMRTIHRLQAGLALRTGFAVIRILVDILMANWTDIERILTVRTVIQ